MKINPKIVIIGIISILLLAVLFVFALFGFRKLLEMTIDDKTGSVVESDEIDNNDKNQLGENEKDDEGDPPIGEGEDLIPSEKDLLPVAESLRSLEGLMVQINQIDVCKSPEVEVYANLTNEDGSPITNLRKSDFEVYENNQRITDFEFRELRNDEIPMSVTLVLDRSGSMLGEPMQKAKSAANDFISKLKSDDQISIVEFGTDVKTLLNFTKDKAEAKNVINSIQVRGNTSLYDAVGNSSQNSPECGRRAVVLLSDGEDTSSKVYDLQNAIGAANLKNVPIYVVGLVGIDWNPSALEQISSETGAQYFEAPTPDDLNALYDTINNQLRAQHLFVYETTLPSGDKRVKIIANKDGANTESEKSYRDE